MRPAALFRTLLIALFLGAAVWYVPSHAGLDSLTALLAVIFAASLMAPAAVQAYLRRNRLRATIARELMKLRRVYHISRHLADGHEEVRAWFTDLHGRLYEYLSFFGSKDFAGYASSDRHFRQLSYHVYAIPETLSAKQQLMYAELLDTVADVAEAREQLKSLLADRLPKSEVMALVVGVGVSLSAAVLSAGTDEWSRGLAGLLAFAAYLGYERIVDLDACADLLVAMPARYTENLARLEYRHREDER
jgi:hypothetical protein